MLFAMNKDVHKAEESIWWRGWSLDDSRGVDQPETGRTVKTSTRNRILLAAFREVHLNGFQAASIQNIIDAAGVTKGALYHYFTSKDEIGFALLDEVFIRYVESTWIGLLHECDDPITALIDYLRETGGAMTDADVALGCPLDHFAQEMAPLNDGFQQRIERLFERQHEAMLNAIQRGQAAGTVVADIDAASIAMMIDATLQGCMAMAKQSRSLDTLMMCGTGLIHYLEQLRPKSKVV